MSRSGKAATGSIQDSMSECAECGAVKSAPDGGPLKRCAECSAIYFCCKDHQREMWKNGHKEDCPMIRERLDELTKIREKAGQSERAMYLSQGLAKMYGLGARRDRVSAVDDLKRAAEQGQPIAALELAHCYRKGIVVSQDDAKAVRYYRVSADQGVPEAQYRLGWCYDVGQGIDQDQKMAVDLFQKASHLGYAQAHVAFGHVLVHGHAGVKPDPKGAVALFKKAGCPSGDYQLSLCYMDGVGVEQNKEKALKLLMKAADAKFIPAVLKLGDFYETEQPNRVAEAKKCYKIASQAGYPEGQYHLAICLLHEDGEGDVAKALTLLEKASARQYDPATCTLATMYGDGSVPDCGDLDGLDKAWELLQSVTSQSDMLASSQIAVAERFLLQDDADHRARAAELLASASAAGRRSQLRAQALSAEMDMYDDLESALQVFQLAGEIGDGRAISNMVAVADAYRERRDFREALDIYWDAWRLGGNPEGLFKYGEMYFFGTGVTKNKRHAVECFHEAAEKGSGDAAYTLFEMEYRTGHHAQAEQWLEKAVAAHCPEALSMKGISLYHQERYDEALSCFEELDSPEVAYHTAMCYKGLSKERDYLDRLLPLTDYGPALGELGFYYANGAPGQPCGVPEDDVKAAKYFEQATKCATRLDPDDEGDWANTARFSFGLCCLHGCGVEQDVSYAIKLLKSSGSRGRLLNYAVGLVFEGMPGEADLDQVPRVLQDVDLTDVNQCDFFFPRALYEFYALDDDRACRETLDRCATLGLSKGLFVCSQLRSGQESLEEVLMKWALLEDKLRKGIRALEIDRDHGLELLFEVATEGLTEAGNYFAQEYVETNPLVAFKLAERSADAGDSTGKHILREFYLRGYGVKRDTMKAEQLAEEVEQMLSAPLLGPRPSLSSSDSGSCSDSSSSDSSVDGFPSKSLSKMSSFDSNVSSFSTIDTPNSPLKVAAEHRQAAVRAKDSAERQRLLESAFQRYVEASESKDTALANEGKQWLGWCYYSGDGVEKDVQKACQLFKDCPLSGGLYNYTACLYNGEGCDRDLTEAGHQARSASVRSLLDQYMRTMKK